MDFFDYLAYQNANLKKKIWDCSVRYSLSSIRDILSYHFLEILSYQVLDFVERKIFWIFLEKDVGIFLFK